MAGHARAELRVLGPLEVIGAAGPVTVSARKHRQLLAVLAVRADEVRSSDFLVEALWSTQRPSSPGKTLQVYVSQVRRLLPAGIGIATRESGYALELEDGVLDAARFERLLAEGREASRAGNPALAASLLRRALALWRGRAYGEFAYDDFARAEAERLEDLRLAAAEERIAAELELGRHVELLPELRSLTALHPFRERLSGLAMLALYRGGLQAEALAAYAASRTRLVEELGIEPGPELRDLQRRILQQDAALLPRGGVEQGEASLPLPTNLLLGRERELAEIGALLRRDDVRLLVLTGAGGSGKTRLALEAARATRPAFANGAAFVGLAPLHEPDLLAATIASSLGVQAGGDPLEALAAAIGPRELLLVLDNLEQLRDAAPVLVALVSRAPRLTLLVTSRVVLHVTGEHVYSVQPLADDAAAALFLQRAREADARFDPDAADEAAIRGVCARLDRLPLAIELAAGRVPTLAPRELLDRLDPRLPLLTGGPRDLPARQQTLRATLEWSLDLLDEDERRDFARLSVFAGGCTLVAAEAVCETTIDRLSAFVDHNLLVRSVDADGSRYSMLETIRELASELLSTSGETGELRRRHAQWALTLAESLGLSCDELGSGVTQHHHVALAEQDNLRAALDWAAGEDPELGLRIACALEQFWVATSPREGMHRLEALLAGAGEIPLELRARALRDLGGSMSVSGEVERAAEHYEQSLRLYEALGHEAGILRLRHRLVNQALDRRELEPAVALAEETLARACAGGFHFEEACLLDTLAFVRFDEGNLEAAYELERESLEIVRRLGGWAWGVPNKLINLADFANELGRPDEAELHARQALELSRDIGDRIKIVNSLASLAGAARVRGDDERAGRLWGAVEAEEQRAFLGHWAAHRDYYAERVPASPSVDLERGREEGRGLTLDQVVSYALEA